MLAILILGIGLKKLMALPPDLGPEKVLRKAGMSTDQIYARDHAQFTAIAFLVVAAFLGLWGAGLLIRSRRRSRPAPSASPEPETEQTTQERLAELDDLHSRGMIDDDEYTDRRAELMSS